MLLSWSIPFGNYPLEIDIAIWVMVVALCAILCTSFFIYLNRVETKKNLRKVQQAEKIIIDELNEHMLMYDNISEVPDKNLDHTIIKLNRLKGSRIFQETLIDLLVYLRLNFTGGLARMINSTYSRLRLRQFSLQKLRSSKWFTKAQGLKELREMKDRHSLPQVNRLVGDPNLDVRVTAYTAMIQMHAKDAFAFMLTETEELSQWHQILILDTIDKTDQIELPDFKNYLSSDNRSIVMLSAKLIMHYKQFAAIPWIIAMLGHEDLIVRKQLIQTLGNLHTEEAEERLIDIYPAQNTELKASILHALGQIASGNTLPFLQEQFLQSIEFLLVKTSAEAIAAHSEILREQVFTGFSNLSVQQEMVINHYREPINLYGIH